MNAINPKIGLDNVVIAEVLSDDENGIVYGEVKALKGAVNASINPNSSVATDYGDNGAIIAMNNRANTELTFEMTGIDPEVKAFMLGQKYSSGITIETSMDSAPYVAMGFRVWVAGTDENGNKIYQNVWLAKGKFSVPNGGAETKKESISFQHESMTGQFLSTIYVPDGQDSGTIMTSIRTDDASVPSSVKENWFNAPVVSVTTDASKLTVTAALSEGKVILTGAKASGASFVFASSSAVLGQSIIITDASGVAVAGTLSVSTTASASPTITFTPAADAETPAVVTVTSALKDSFGVGATPMIDTSL